MISFLPTTCKEATRHVDF